MEKVEHQFSLASAESKEIHTQDAERVDIIAGGSGTLTVTAVASNGGECDLGTIAAPNPGSYSFGAPIYRVTASGGTITGAVIVVVP